MTEAKKPAKTFLNPVESSAFTHAGYDPAKKEFHVRFKDGGVWVYKDVDQAHEVGFEHAASRGAYFARHIKDKHVGRKV